MKKIINFNLILLLTIALRVNAQIDLSGKWSIQLDEDEVGLEQGWTNRSFSQTINLPGTTDLAGLGTPNTLSAELSKPQLTYLTRNNSYVGVAWYTRVFTVPTDWQDKNIELSLERVIWRSKVWIDGNEVSGIGESLTTPHVFNLTSYIRAGKSQRITIMIDNSKQYPICGESDMVHAYTDHTQIKWNGIIGDIKLISKPNVCIEDVITYPNIQEKNVKTFIVVNNRSDKSQKTNLSLNVKQKTGDVKFKTVKRPIELSAGVDTIEVIYPMGDKAMLWSEFTPIVYEMTASLQGKQYSSNNTVDFGLRSIRAKGNELMINGVPLFLRGTLECCVFPLTGTPPMDKRGWLKVFETSRNWGLNHLRFHSWCPPQAAFEVADSMGFYLQVELPIWNTNITNTNQPKKFMLEEGERIMKEYGNHPSFCFWSMGNELEKDFNVLNNLVNHLKSKDNRHLYCATTFTFEWKHGRSPEPFDDFFITQYTDKGWVRGQGVFNKEQPSFDKDYNTSMENIMIPLITHEIGQYSVYPNLTEIDKYKGVLTPLNFKAVRDDLRRKGMLEKAPLYTKASGKLASILYKEEIERAMKTKGISGFQLLDLHDFPGQGTALVGLLDAFWDSKELITPEEFRGFCSPIVPLARFTKACYTSDEDFIATIEVSNYCGSEFTQDIEWAFSADGTLHKGIIKNAQITNGNSGVLGEIRIPLNKIHKAVKAELKLNIDNKGYNRWNIWVYPASSVVGFGDVIFTRDHAQAVNMAKEGKKILYNPRPEDIKGMDGSFVPVFWSPVHFPQEAKSMGILCNPKHRAFSKFPTDMHTNWQWWDLIIKSKALFTDNIEGITPIVEIIDNFANNRKMNSMFETQCGKGKILVCAFDISENLENRPVAKQLLISLLDYMNSDSFSPLGYNDLDWLRN